MYIRTLVLGDKFTYDRYYGSHSKFNFKPKQVDTVSLTSKTNTATELQAIKDKNRTQQSSDESIYDRTRSIIH